MSDRLVVKGAREHNLRSIDLDLPRDALIVFTGLSGSGKSSLAFDTIYAEGQRRYVESLSAYARQFLGQMEKPRYERIRGLSPTIAIQQKSASLAASMSSVSPVWEHVIRYALLSIWPTETLTIEAPGIVRRAAVRGSTWPV